MVIPKVYSNNNSIIKPLCEMSFKIITNSI